MAARLGYACISVDCRRRNIYCSRKVMIATIRDLGDEAALAELIRLTRLNLQDLARIMTWNEEHGVRFFRISSGIIPHYGNRRLAELGPALRPWAGASRDCLDPFRIELAEIRDLARKWGHRLTMHPGQYCQLGSPRSSVVEDTIRELESHSHFLDALELPPTGRDAAVLILHGGGVYESVAGPGQDPRALSLGRWAERFAGLDPTLSRRIVLENDELYSIEELLPTCQKLGVPLCVDFFHDRLRGERERGGVFCADLPDLMTRAFATWRGSGVKCHLSEQAPGARRGMHADRVETIPESVLRLMVSTPFDLCIESKDKDESVFQLWVKYPQLPGSRQSI